MFPKGGEAEDCLITGLTLEMSKITAADFLVFLLINMLKLIFTWKLFTFLSVIVYLRKIGWIWFKSFEFFL